MRIRRATAADAPAVATVFIETTRQSLPFLPDIHTDKQTRDWIRDVVLVDCEVHLVEVDGSVVAMLAVRPGWIDHLYVHPDHQNVGIGSALLRLAMQSSPRELRLYAFLANTNGCAFYEHHGFRAEEFGDGSGNMERLPDVLYVWRPV